jgi:hypothetical protein
MKRLKDLRVKEMIILLNKWEYKRAISLKKLMKYKQKLRKYKAREEHIKLDRLVCKLHNRILKRIPKETILISGKQILKDNLYIHNNYTKIVFY